MEPFCYLCDNQWPGGEVVYHPEHPGRMFYICRRCSNYYVDEDDKLLDEIDYTFRQTEEEDLAWADNRE